MSNIFTLLKLEIKNNYGSIRLSNPKSILKLLSSLLFALVMAFVIYLGAQKFFEMFATASLAYESLVLVCAVIFIFLLIMGISSVTKVLYYKGDNEMLMRFPIQGYQVFIAKTLFLLITQIVLVAIIIIPFFIAYSKSVTVPDGFFSGLPILLVFMVFIPFFLSNLAAIPFMHISNRIRHKFGLVIFCMILLVTAIFALYMLVFQKMVLYIKDSSFSVFSPSTIASIRDMVVFAVPFKYFADIMLKNNVVVAYSVLYGLMALTGGGTLFLIIKLYQKTLLKNIEIEGSAYTHVTKNRCRNIFFTLLKKEFLQVFRSINYSFQYFVLAFSMPFMVYSCNNIAIQVGKDDIGMAIIPGLTLLVMLIFNTVIISFSATSITREGSNFYHTKIIPVKLHTQLFVKFFMYFTVSLLANIITSVILAATKQLSYSEVFLIFGIVQVVSVALTLKSMKYDIKKPRFNLSGEGELVNNNSNTTASIFLGFVLSVVFGMVSMFLSFIFGEKIMYPVIIICAAAVFLYCLVSYFFRLQKTYNRIT